MPTMQTDLMRGALDFVEGSFDVTARVPFDRAPDAAPEPPPVTEPRLRPGPGPELEPSVFPDPDESFGARMRAVRERRRISIASIAESTKILGALLEGLENDDVSRWPTGLYRRAFMRAYATAIGLDPEPIVREFIARFPDPEDTPAPVAVVAAPLPGTRAVLRLTLAEPGGTFAAGDLVHEVRRRLVAVVADAAVLGAIAGGLYLVVGSFWAPLAVAIAAYYFGSIVLLGNTPGVCLVASRAAETRPSGWAASRRLLGWSAATGLANRARTAWLARWQRWLGRD
jgi:transcriptional regulator with XRE-family HTH domain